MGGLSLRYAKVDDSELLLLRSDLEHNPIGVLHLSLVEREQPNAEFVMVLHPTVNLEDEYRSSQTKDKKGSSKILTSERRVVRLPFFIGAFAGYLYL